MAERARRLIPASCSKRAPVAPDASGILDGAGVPICVGTPRGPFYSHRSWMAAHGTSRRHYAGPGVTLPFQINCHAGAVEASHSLLASEAALAGVAIGTAR